MGWHIERRGMLYSEKRENCFSLHQRYTHTDIGLHNTNVLQVTKSQRIYSLSNISIWTAISSPKALVVLEGKHKLKSLAELADCPSFLQIQTGSGSEDRLPI